MLLAVRTPDVSGREAEDLRRLPMPLPLAAAVLVYVGGLPTQCPSRRSGSFPSRSADAGLSPGFSGTCFGGSLGWASVLGFAYVVESVLQGKFVLSLSASLCTQINRGSETSASSCLSVPESGACSA